uniref:Carbohydrate sulfotransferase n=1 Tax=Ciona savignyi TaxID=51511 RepID=H2Z449_CIOSA
MIRMEKRMAQRRLRVKKKCEELGIWQNITNYNLENIPNPKPWMFLSEQYKLMYCEIPKSGCTNWKKVLMVLNGIVNSTDGIKQGQAHTQSLKMLRSVPRSERDKLYQSGTKLMVVRQPFERLVSAYQDKVAARPPHNDSIFFQFSSEVAKKYGRQRKDTEPTTLNDGTRSITVCPVGEANLECSGKWEVIHITSAL